MNQYEWKYGENNCQKYYEVKLGKDYLCVFANEWNSNTWLGAYIKCGCGSVTIGNKTFNDKQRKRNPRMEQLNFGIIYLEKSRYYPVMILST